MWTCGLPNHQKGESSNRYQCEERDGETRQPSTEPRLKHRDIVAGSALEDAKGTALRDHKGHALTGKHCDREPQPSVSPPAEGANPEITQASELAHPYCIVKAPQHSGLRTERKPAIRHWPILDPAKAMVVGDRSG